MSSVLTGSRQRCYDAVHMLAEFVESLLAGAAESRREDTSWALAAGRAAAAEHLASNVTAAVVGGEILVNVMAQHFGRQRLWAQARVRVWDGEEVWEEFVERSVILIVNQLVAKLDARDRGKRR